MANLPVNLGSLCRRCSEGWRFVLSIFAVVLVLRLPTLFTGFYNPDETCYATIAARIIEGKLLYRDIIDHKPPAIYYLYSLFVLIGKSHAIYVAHAAMIFIVTATSLAVSGIANILELGRKTAVIAAILYALGASMGKPNDVAAANAELIFNLPLALMVYFAMRAWRGEISANSPSLLAASGFMAGIAALIKPQAVFAVAAVLSYLNIDGRAKFTRRISGSALVVLAAVIPAALVAGVLYFKGVLGDAIYWGISVNSLYMQGHEGGAALLIRFVRQTSYMLLAEQGAFWLPCALWIVLKKKGDFLLPSAGCVVYLWLAFSTLAVVPGQRFYGHYYLQMLPPLSIITAAAVWNLKGMITWRKTAAAVLAVLIFVPLLHSWIWAWPISAFRTAIEAEENKLLVEYLKLATSPNQKIEVWGRFNGIPFLAGGENGTRFLNKNLLAGSFRREELVKMPDSHWRLYFYDLEKNRPEWFVDHSGVDMKDAPLAKFPRLASYIAANYEEIAEVSGSRIYRRK